MVARKFTRFISTRIFYLGHHFINVASHGIAAAFYLLLTSGDLSYQL
ncbi:Uncharacterised protein [Vibrio cholerae]|nr:Uncharacterised protein [Vibrio cholerae]